MNKKVLATALLCFSLLLPAFSLVSTAASSSELEEEASYEIASTTAIDTTLSQQELFGLPGYVTAREEPVYPAITLETTKSLSGSTTTDPIDPMIPGPWEPPPPPPPPPTPKPAPVHTMIVVDDDLKSFYRDLWYELGFIVDPSWSDVYNWANNVLEGGDDPFWSWYEIDFVATEYRAWDSPSGSLAQLLGWAQQTFPKPSGVEVTFVFTGQAEFPLLGRGERPGDAFIVSAWAGSWFVPLVNVWQHEASHNYDAGDHDPGIFDWCIMSYTWSACTRNWCGSCSSVISQNKYRFGTIYV